jgi:hypothetical protein
MSISTRGICWPLPLTLTVAAIAGPVAHASQKPDGRTAALITRHFQHEDALYGNRLGTPSGQTPAQLIARHFKHEDALYAARPVTGQTRTPAQAVALHFQHEDALYRATAPTSSRSALAAQVATSHGFDWNDALVGAGSTVALLLFGAAAMVAIRRSRSRLAQS